MENVILLHLPFKSASSSLDFLLDLRQEFTAGKKSSEKPLLLDRTSRFEVTKCESLETNGKVGGFFL